MNELVELSTYERQLVDVYRAMSEIAPYLGEKKCKI